MTMNDLTPIARQILGECREDYVGLWSIVRRIRGAGVEDRTRIIETTLPLLTQLLSEGRIKVGQFSDQKFHEWKVQPQDAIAKIESEWKKLGRDPDIGEVAWFVAAETPT